MNAINKAFNHAYGVKESRTYFISRGMSIILTLAMIFVFIVALLLPVFGNTRLNMSIRLPSQRTVQLF